MTVLVSMKITSKETGLTLESSPDPKLYSASSFGAILSLGALLSGRTLRQVRFSLFPASHQEETFGT